VYLDPALGRVFDAARSWARRPATALSPSNGVARARFGEGHEAGKILANAGVTPQTLNAAIEALRKGRTADSASAENAYDALKKYARDLTQAARDGKLDPVIGRDEEIRRTIQVLSRRTKNNPVLIASPGVARPRSSKAWRCALSTATGRRACRTRSCWPRSRRADCWAKYRRRVESGSRPVMAEVHRRGRPLPSLHR